MAHLPWPEASLSVVGSCLAGQEREAHSESSLPPQAGVMDPCGQAAHLPPSQCKEEWSPGQQGGQPWPAAAGGRPCLLLRLCRVSAFPRTSGGLNGALLAKNFPRLPLWLAVSQLSQVLQPSRSHLAKQGLEASLHHWYGPCISIAACLEVSQALHHGPARRVKEAMTYMSLHLQEGHSGFLWIK